jgi:muconolactone delta-isomerase
LWHLYQLLATKGKGYHLSQGDGLFYSYSVFNNYKQLKKNFKHLQLLSYIHTGIKPLSNSPHVALFAYQKIKTDK